MKAILVIDIPEKHLNFINAEKGLKKVDIGYGYDEKEGWSYASYKLLALKPMPEIKEQGYPTDDYTIGKADGWNDCIKEIEK